MKKEQVDLENAVVWIPDSKTPNGIAEVPLTDLARERFGSRFESPDREPTCFRATRIQQGIRRRSRRSGTQTLKRQGSVLPDLRSAFYLCDSAQRGGVADEWVTQLLRQGDAKVFKKYSQMKLQMKREALEKMNRKANEDGRVLTR